MADDWTNPPLFDEEAPGATSLSQKAWKQRKIRQQAIRASVMGDNGSLIPFKRWIQVNESVEWLCVIETVTLLMPLETIELNEQSLFIYKTPAGDVRHSMHLSWIMNIAIMFFQIIWIEWNIWFLII